MNRDKVVELTERAKEMLGAEQMLAEVVESMSTDEAEGTLRWISRMWDLGLFDDQEDDE